MRLDRQLLILVIVFLLVSGLAQAGLIALTPLPSDPASLVTEYWGLETTGTPTFGAGWQVTAGDIDFVPASFWPWMGPLSTAIDLAGSTPGTISNQMQLDAGSYVLAFLYTYNPDDSTNLPREGLVSMTGAANWSAQLGPFINTNTVIGPGNTTGPEWFQFSQIFTSTGGPVTLSLSAVSHDWRSIVLLGDGVRLSNLASGDPGSDVPEPWSLGLVGAGLALLALRRRHA
jgi:hypothetical protein